MSDPTTLHALILDLRDGESVTFERIGDAPEPHVLVTVDHLGARIVQHAFSTPHIEPHAPEFVGITVANMLRAVRR